MNFDVPLEFIISNILLIEGHLPEVHALSISILRHPKTRRCKIEYFPL